MSFNVRDSQYGAVGDFSPLTNVGTDDAAAFQAVANAAGSTGGCKITVPAGNYLLNSPIDVSNRDGLTWECDSGAHFYKTAGSYAYFLSMGAQPGWGSGVRGFTWFGGVFHGDFARGLTRCAFNFHHGQELHFERVDFTEMQGAGHTADLGGCDGAVFKHCHFYGFHLPAGHAPSSVSAEAIQLDQSQFGSIGGMPGSFDGELTKNVTVEHCKFLPITVAGVTYPAPNPLGGHGLREGKYYQGIKFLHNRVENPREQIVAADTSPTVSNWGIMHLPVVRDLTIHDNTFVMTAKRPTRVITLTAWDNEILATSDPNVAPTKGLFASPSDCRDITITDNRFLGFMPADGATAQQEVIYMAGLPNAPIANVKVDGNIFQSTYNPANTGGARAVMRLNYVHRLSGRNIFVNLAHGPQVQNSTAVTIGGEFTQVRAYTVIFQACKAPRFDGNTITQGMGPAQSDVNCTSVSFDGNDFVDAPDVDNKSTCIVIQGKSYKLKANTAEHAAGSTGPRAFVVTNVTAQDGIIQGNSSKGYTRGLEIAGSAGGNTLVAGMGLSIVGNKGLGAFAGVTTGSVVADNI